MIDVYTEKVWGVAALVLAVADTLAARWFRCTVRGELIGFSRASSGHCYFSLKDAQGQDHVIRCALFKRMAGLLDFVPEDGQHVQLQGQLTIYGPRGELQLVVEHMQNLGNAQALMAQFKRLKEKLEALGMFSPERKRPLPAFVRCVAVITSLTGAALHDVLSTFSRRSPHVELLIVGSIVQGPQAPTALVQALEWVARQKQVDSVLLCRGGGSMEDLWAFNDESLVRSICACPVPVVCGVGHETDFTLADFAADVRAPTPTAGAELLAPRTMDCVARLQQLVQRLSMRVAHQRLLKTQSLDFMSLHWTSPREILRAQQKQLELLNVRSHKLVKDYLDCAQQTNTKHFFRLHKGVEQALRAHQEQWRVLSARLGANENQHLHKLGFVRLLDQQNNPISSIQSITTNQSLQAILRDGTLDLQVVRIHNRSVD